MAKSTRHTDKLYIYSVGSPTFHFGSYKLHGKLIITRSVYKNKLDEKAYHKVVTKIIKMGDHKSVILSYLFTI